MSSYSEYLNRAKMRLPNYVDTRPHRDAGHQTEVVKRLAASAVQESKTPRSAGVLVLNGPSTQVRSFYAKAHTVQDMSVFQDYESGQAVAQAERNRPASQIQGVCYSADVIREKQDTLRLYPQEALKQAAINNLKNCCRLCGEPIQYTTACPCNASGAGLKDTRRRFTTPS